MYFFFLPCHNCLPKREKRKKCMSFIHKITEEIFFSKAQLYNDPFLFTIMKINFLLKYSTVIQNKKRAANSKTKGYLGLGGWGRRGNFIFKQWWQRWGSPARGRQICDVFFTIEQPLCCATNKIVEHNIVVAYTMS